MFECNDLDLKCFFFIKTIAGKVLVESVFFVSVIVETTVTYLCSINLDINFNQSVGYSRNIDFTTLHYNLPILSNKTPIVKGYPFNQRLMHVVSKFICFITFVTFT